jgi:hypothetical protein
LLVRGCLQKKRLRYKRLEAGNFGFPPPPEHGHAVEMRATDLAMLLDGVELESVQRRKRYRRPATTSSVTCKRSVNPPSHGW